MKLEQQVCTLEQAKKLMALGGNWKPVSQIPGNNFYEPKNEQEKDLPF